jgi:hypothetical protein
MKIPRWIWRPRPPFSPRTVIRADQWLGELSYSPHELTDEQQQAVCRYIRDRTAHRWVWWLSVFVLVLYLALGFALGWQTKDILPILLPVADHLTSSGTTSTQGQASQDNESVKNFGIVCVLMGTFLGMIVYHIGHSIGTILYSGRIVRDQRKTLLAFLPATKRVS